MRPGLPDASRMDPAADVPLADALAALASPTRLRLLRALRTPRILADIRVRAPGREREGPLARQTVSKHLQQLHAAGIVSTREVVADRGETVEFFLKHQAIYAISEEVRDLARLRSTVDPPEATVQKEGRAKPGDLRAPCLVLVKGLEDGATFDLTPDPPRAVEWVIGRRRGLAIALDYDPFVSAENTLVRWTPEKGHVVTSIPGSRNGTLVNYAPLPPGESRALRHGDLVSVGRSTLSYWSPPA